jgi:hypothetical protein
LITIVSAYTAIWVTKALMNLNNRKSLSPVSVVAGSDQGFDSIGGEVVSTTAFVLGKPHHPLYQGAYFRLVDGNSEAEKAAMFKEALA